VILNGVLFRFEEAELDTAAYELRVDGARVPVEPQVFEVLTYLVEHRGRLVPRTEILDAVWGDRFVSDSALASRIAAARAAIGDDGRTQRCIRTVHGRGVQFVAPVEILDSVDPPTPEPSTGDLHQSVRFVTAPDGLQLAVATVGSGPPMIKAANWLTHVEKDWRSPVWRHWLAELGTRYQFTRYDARGCGLSDWDLRGSDMTDVDLWTDDLEAVVENSGADRFVLLGVSQGAVPAIAYSIRHPERVSHLVIFGGYTRGMRRRDETALAESETNVELMRVGWGGAKPAFRSFFTMTFLPEATSEQIRWFNELQADSTNTENALLLETAFYELDMTELASQVSVPTLVMHCRDDMASPYAEGRRLASLIPGAEFVTLESPNHVLLADEPAWPEFLAQVDRFTGG
jgi:pimeloyl-ACP methyl ester carboxylesterase